MSDLKNETVVSQNRVCKTTIANDFKTSFKEKLSPEKLENWDKIMSNAYVVQFTIAFVVICVLEYYFSREIYRDILPQAPWVIGIGIIFISIVIAELLVGIMSSHIRRKRFYEEKKVAANAIRPDSDIRKDVLKHARVQFVFGLILFIYFFLINIIYML